MSATIIDFAAARSASVDARIRHLESWKFDVIAAVHNLRREPGESNAALERRILAKTKP